MRKETIELDALLRNAACRRRRARMLFDAAKRAEIVLLRRPMMSKERSLRKRLGIQSIFPEAPVRRIRKPTP